MLWHKKEKSPLEKEMEELAVEWSREELDSARRQELIRRYMELDARRLEHEKLKKEHGIDAKTVLSTGTTLLLAVATLEYERTDTIRSKISQWWLRRRV